MVAPEGLRIVTIRPELRPLQRPLAAVQRLLQQFGDQGLVIGGVASSLLGRPRLTADVDMVILLSTGRLNELIAAAGIEGLALRIPNALEFARQHRVLLLVEPQSGIGVDISLGMLPFEEEAVKRGEWHTVGELELRLPSPDDLIIMKAVASRTKDLLDIEGIVERHPDLDVDRIERWLRSFAEALDAPEIWTRVASLLPSSR